MVNKIVPASLQLYRKSFQYDQPILKDFQQDDLQMEKVQQLYNQ